MFLRNKRLTITLLSCLTFLLAACGGQAAEEATLPTLASDSADTTDTTDEDTSAADDAQDTAADDAQAAPPSDASLDDLAAGDYELTISGALTSDGTYNGLEEPIQYEPFNSPNNAGEHELEIFADVGETEFTTETTEVEIVIRFPATIEPGTYDIITREGDLNGQVQASVRFDTIGATSFDENVSGTLNLIEAGEQMTATFNFNATANRGDEPLPTIDVSGRINQLPFNYRPQGSITLSGLVEREFTPMTAFEDDAQRINYQYGVDDFTGDVRWDTNYFDNDFAYNAQVLIYLPADATPGTYDVARAPSDGNRRVPDGAGAGARLRYEEEATGIDFSADTITGTVTLDIDERGYANATYDITGTDPETGESLSATGSFQYFESQFGQSDS